MTTESKEFTWKMLKAFIEKQIEEHGEEWLENKLFLECQDPKNINPGFQTKKDSEGWVYSEIMHDDGTPFCTIFDDGTVSLNINF